MEDYTVQAKIGDGAQGVVYRVQHIHTGSVYAMKVICCADQAQVDLALKEIKVLLQLRHPSIVSYIDFFLVFNSAKIRQEFETAAKHNGAKEHLTELDDAQKNSVAASSDHTSSLRLFGTAVAEKDGAPSARAVETTGVPAANILSEGVRAHWMKEEEIAVCLVMELCGNGDMAGTIRETKQKMMETGTHPIPEAQVLSWMEQCTAALECIHAKGFLHRDLKPTNVFFDTYRDIRIGDFGLAATVGNGGRNSAVGTPYYLAPERMLQQRYDGKVDVWGLGVIILELVTLREQPINSMVLENPQAVESVVQNVTRMGFSAKLAALLRDMLQRYPDNRPSASTVLNRLSSMTVSSPHLGLSASMFAGMSCPKLSGALCDVCEVEAAAVSCLACKQLFCEGCDRARHKHHSRQSHERLSLSGLSGASVSLQLQQTLSTSRSSPGTVSEQTRSLQSPTVLAFGAGSRNLSQEPSVGQYSVHQFPQAPTASNSRAFARLHTALNPPANSGMSISDFSLTQSMLPARQCLVGSCPGSPLMTTSSAAFAAADTILRVPADFPTLVEALRAAVSLRHVRKILVSGNTVHNAPIELTKALPESLKIVGESPPPVLEVADSPHALHCMSGKGVVENFVIRHVGRVSRKALTDVTTGNKLAPADEQGAIAKKKPPRPSAISITGGSWAIRRCRISCVDGSGITVGRSSQEIRAQQQQQRTGNALGNMRDPIVTNYDEAAEDEDDGDGDAAGVVVDPVVYKCFFMDVTTAGIVVQERARGLYEGNTFSGCGYAAFLLKRESSARVRANRITDGTETGIFCQDAQGSVEYNLIAQNAGCGVVVKGAGTTTIFRKNRVLSNGQAGFFCCDKASPFISDNEVGHNHKAGVLIKTKASPKVSRNLIEGGQEAGVYVFENGGGIIEENRILSNRNAGLLVTTHGAPHVINNVLSKNAYEGIWICKDGAGTFCDNDLRNNVRGPMDVDKTCKVTWVGNKEQ